MTLTRDSLFSLEIVVDKLYVPYVTCRFPAVAFRLLDFPTILINHVEPELQTTIKKRIEKDPYYRVPNQFADLQDKAGNFMVKKGKSCLFKIPAETLSQHLANTPMYIMVIDEYPEVPKLLGNSSLALNEVMDKIVKDIKLNGPTVPSVQGDKGLFKIYSLMGKEIGYMIMGFRLLSLGPGLIDHLPRNVMVGGAEKQKTKEKMISREKGSKLSRDNAQEAVIEDMIVVREHTSNEAVHAPYSGRTRKPDLNNTREMGSMTEVNKCDVLSQTLPMEEEQKAVKVSDKEEKLLKTIQTQTERNVEYRKKKQNFQVVKEDSESDDDGVIINPNIVCPPPLFYNCQAQPEIQIERDFIPYLQYSRTFDEITLEDLSGDEQGNNLEPEIEISKPKVKRTEVKSSGIVENKPQPQATTAQVQIPMLNLEAPTTGQPVFPMLTALLAELSKIQNPQFIHQAMQQVNEIQATKSTQNNVSTASKMNKSVQQKHSSVIEVDESAVSVKKKGRHSNKNLSRNQSNDEITKNKGWMRKTPCPNMKKTKLVFGLTNTQRLRLQKQNPNWLETKEKEVKANKMQKQKAKQKDQEEEIETGNLSDTYTQVRRLAAKELEKGTLTQSQVVPEPKVKKLTKKGVKSREKSPAKPGHMTKDMAPKAKRPTENGLKETVKVRETESDSLQNTVSDFNTHDRQSPVYDKEDKQDSLVDSVPSSRIEVHIPSARALDDSECNTLNQSYDDDDMATDRKDTRSPRFPGFSRGDDTLPESIPADNNQSFNTTLDEDSPLESTRVSKQFKPDLQTGESVFKSTDDYDTKGFHSTDEPELQQLISEDEKSESQPTPVTDLSNRSDIPGFLGTATNNTTTNQLSRKFEIINPKSSMQSPLPAMRRSQQLKVDSMNAHPTPTDSPRSRSSQPSPRQPTPRARKLFRERRLEFKKDSIHTESVSSYMPSESENILSLISDGSYSDDFHMSSEKEDSSKLSVSELPKFIPSTKLGFTIT